MVGRAVRQGRDMMSGYEMKKVRAVKEREKTVKINIDLFFLFRPDDMDLLKTGKPFIV